MKFKLTVFKNVSQISLPHPVAMDIDIVSGSLEKEELTNICLNSHPIGFLGGDIYR